MQAILIHDSTGDYKVITAHGDNLEIKRIGRVIETDITIDTTDKRHANARPVIDHKTDKTYKSITDWCQDVEMSRVTAHRLLHGERDEVKGHSLSYLEDEDHGYI